MRLPGPLPTMKPRRVIVPLELETDLPLAVLAKRNLWQRRVNGVSKRTGKIKVVQVGRPNVIR